MIEGGEIYPLFMNGDNMAEPFKVKISVSDIESFKSLVEYIGKLVADTRIPLEIRNEVMDKLEKIMEEK